MRDDYLLDRLPGSRACAILGPMQTPATRPARRAVARLLCALCALSSPAFAQSPVAIVTYNGLGTTNGAWLSGRALEDKGLEAPGPRDSTRKKITRMWQALASNEVAGAKLTVTVAGKAHRLTTDSEGMFELALPGPLPVGSHPVQVQVRDHPRWRAFPAVVDVFPARAATVVISDFDDTVVATHVTNKWRMLKKLATTSDLDLAPFPGAPALYRDFRRRGWPVVFVSGSPVNLYLRIHRFLRRARFPVAPLLLKQIGRRPKDNALLAHEGYKRKQIAHIMRLLPGYRLVLIGDSGERDPEVYRSVARRYPERIQQILIHNVTGSKPSDKRFAGQQLFSDYRALRL